MKLIIFWKAGKKAGLLATNSYLFYAKKIFFCGPGFYQSGVAIWNGLILSVAELLIHCFVVIYLFIHLNGFVLFSCIFFLLLNPLLNSYATILLLSAILVKQLCLTWLCLIYFSMSFSQNFAFLSEVCEEDSRLSYTKTKCRITEWMPWEKNLIDLSY